MLVSKPKAREIISAQKNAICRPSASRRRKQGKRSLAVALSRNSLGELYMRIGRLDEAAETNSVFAVEVRDNTEPHLDAAVSRENLGQLYEMKGSL